MFQPISETTEATATAVIGAAIEVHRELGPGFLERIYQDALCFELSDRQIPFEREKAVVVRYKKRFIGGQRIDLVVAKCSHTFGRWGFGWV